MDEIKNKACIKEVNKEIGRNYVKMPNAFKKNKRKNKR